MRMIVKGGVWKNTEDEILKAAVMKYGKNQWARIASLLHRKTAKQCKARWYEWLDPSIKKTEWTREEEEKLLHLAKLFPTQWRTIAPMIGRTGGQCLAHYEYLLDQAQQKEDGMEEADPRKLRPGEVDPNSESKPARPDPVDMDEDEKEMLSEARARLANTVGKKAKRKAREKQLEEARRLSMLQKRRELRAAGVELKKRQKFGKHRIDYNEEIPFEKKVPVGFYDTSNERVMESNTEFKAKTLEQLEGKRRDKEEAELRKKDKEKSKDRKSKAMGEAIKLLNKDNEPQRKRTKLVLPAPQVSDAELERIVKVGAQSMAISDEADGEVTGELLSDYSATPASVMPTRTPRVPQAEDTILKEAQNLIALTNTETPLLGGANVNLNNSSFKGLTPARSVLQTPNTVLGTPAHPGSVLPGQAPSIPMTPRLGDGRLAPTPARDSLRINRFDSGETPGSVSRNEMMNNKTGLLAGLRALPKPKNDFEVVVPDMMEDAGEDTTMMREEDAEEIEAQRQAAEAKALELELSRRSEALKRGLPRPSRVNAQAGVADLSGHVTDLHFADVLICKEMVQLLRRDAKKYPVGGHRPKIGGNVSEVSDEDLQNARELLAEESNLILQEAMGDMAMAEFERFCVETWEKSRNQITYIPTQNKFGRVTLAKPEERLAARKEEFKSIMDRLKKDGYKKAAKLEKKAAMYTSGFQKRAETLKEEIKTANEQLLQASIDYKCFTALRAAEQASITGRVEALERETQRQEKLLAAEQERYSELVSRREHLQSTIASS
ncbi:hypothetical protein, variant [Sphaeroforma arctica JP610]|uniref:Cell division cycle 5-like protein n=1 Tax=Sphaeroforma arctica JP610 TaxID=667725 RepID=A0A0L0FYV1_9EUKA|nr:hypothetical protein, variant [Sphaeroforma arctica JP610]KNC81736.1 hypothetical protein, variant [Sphaeroforma arctica JP610]|eukprot:XP_014155638.1 hypothetical protein, variant [Sphaeroforma arctica JP610]